jgi:YVTN family beta-propeller protein
MATAETVAVDGVSAQRLRLPTGSAPIGVELAFGSIWIANHRLDSVTRLDPTTLAVIATIPVAHGPGWFAATKDAIWVSNQLGRGLTRIDPATNTEVARAGQWPTCGQPLVALDKLWQPACDAHQIMRIDPATNEVWDVSAGSHLDVFLHKGTILAVSPEGVARFDPTAETFTEIGGCCGHFVGFDGETVWLSDDAKVVRVNPADGSVVKTLPLANAGMGGTFRDGQAWLPVGSTIVEIDLKTSEVLRTLKGILAPTALLDTGDALWVTGFDHDEVWRLEP